MSPILSICVVTMNRAQQLKAALESCLACKLPKETEFVVVDNASADDTERVVKSVLDNCGYSYIYKRLEKNYGCGGGRNIAFSESSGKFFYMLDDDAVIDFSYNSDFFISAIDIFESNPNIMSLTTQIYDEMWKGNRLRESKYVVSSGVFLCKMFCGGSHFLRKSFFDQPPYLANKYGYEELVPSFYIWDTNGINVYASALRIIHKPKVNKWDYNDKSNNDIIINECAIPYAIKMILFPPICSMVLRFFYFLRCLKYLSKIPNGKKQANKIAEEYVSLFGFHRKIRFSTVISLVKKFGFEIL